MHKQEKLFPNLRTQILEIYIQEEKLFFFFNWNLFVMTKI